MNEQQRSRVGAWIVAAREALGLRQDELAVAAGIGRSTLHNVETGKSAANRSTLRGLGDALTGDDRTLLRVAAGEDVPLPAAMPVSDTETALRLLHQIRRDVADLAERVDRLEDPQGR